MEFSKKDKQAARRIIDKGLQCEFEQGLLKTETIISNWRKEKTSQEETYHTVYQHVKKFDKQISQRYDGLTPAHYAITLVGQLIDEVIHEDDLIELSDEAQLYLKQAVKTINN
jgi:hypothetical protein